MPRKTTKKIMRGGSNAEEEAAAEVLGSNDLTNPAAEVATEETEDPPEQPNKNTPPKGQNTNDPDEEPAPKNTNNPTPQGVAGSGADEETVPNVEEDAPANDGANDPSNAPDNPGDGGNNEALGDLEVVEEPVEGANKEAEQNNEEAEQNNEEAEQNNQGVAGQIINKARQVVQENDKLLTKVETMEKTISELRNERNALKRQMKNKEFKQELNRSAETNKRHTEKIGKIKEEMNKRQSARAQTDASQDASISDLVSKLAEVQKEIERMAKQDKVQSLENEEVMEVYQSTMMELIEENKHMMKQLGEIKRMTQKSNHRGMPTRRNVSTRRNMPTRGNVSTRRNMPTSRHTSQRPKSRRSSNPSGRIPKARSMRRQRPQTKRSRPRSKPVLNNNNQAPFLIRN